MPICETCHASFEESEGPVEVVTTRILCQACMAEYQAAKAARKAGRGAASAPASAATARAATPPARTPAPTAPAEDARRSAGAPPTPRPAAPEAPKSAPVKPTGAPAARTAAPAAARPASPAAKKVVAPAEAKPVAKPAGTGGAGRMPAPKKRAADLEFIKSETEALKRREKRTIWIGAGLALVLLGVAGGAVAVALGKRKADEEALAAYRKSVEDFHAAFMAIDITTEAGCQQAIALGDEKRSLWENEDIAPEIQSRHAKAKTTLELLVERKSLLERLAQVQQTLADTSQASSESLAETRRVLDDLESRSSVIGTEATAQVGALRAQADRAYAERLLDEARSSASAEGGRAALAKFARAEEEIYKVLEKANRSRSEAEKDYRDLYQQAIQGSDELADKVFDQAAIEALPWRDLLSSEEGANWLAPAMAGFEHRLENGVLHLIGPAPEALGQGIISIGDKENWRDVVLDFEFTIDKGSFRLYFRLGPSTADATQAIDYTTDPEKAEARNAGESYHSTASYVGSRFLLEEDGQVTIDSKVGWTNRRKGAIGITIPKGAEVRFTKMRIKALR
jgi:uncharacterized membrane-anchored protein YhcB (DUF1043 family)